MHKKHFMRFLSTTAVLLVASAVRSETVEINERRFTIPDGYELKLAIEPGLSERPIVVDFDHEGNLYVAESSGTNDSVQKQLREKPHSILRLRDTNNDGIFDKRTVFADRMMFPEGVMWHRGSVYVSAPPQIWKLTDTDDDGVADEREVWFDAKTLTGCANDLHGPYAGLDGWIYWCKGAFAEQTHERADDGPFVTRAAHIFRRRLEGGVVEPVMTGGMDNPVDVIFTETGERIFTTTFFQHPANGQRDGLVHAIYGGVYGKRHGVIDGHPRTGELMPVMTHLGAAAPSGLTRLESNALGFKNQLLTACFNLHSVTRHELFSRGATFTTKDTNLVSSDDLDFHPTDVIEDADGSVLIIDTGGWYKLCCPTSQLHKPDIPGAIYRLTKSDTHRHPDPRGTRIDWPSTSVERLAALLSDDRFAVQNRAMEELATRGNEAIPAIHRLCQASLEKSGTSLRAVWTACRIDSLAARQAVRLGLNHNDPKVRQAAAHAASVWRDAEATDRLIELLVDDMPQVQRAAAEAIGRIDSREAIPQLLDSLKGNVDRILEHSLIYALIEINSAEHLRQVLHDGTAKQKVAALTAIRGMRANHLSLDEVLSLLKSDDSELRTLATGIANEHPEWIDTFVEFYRHEVDRDEERLDELSATIGLLAGQPAMDGFIVELLTKTGLASEEKLTLLNRVSIEGEIANAMGGLLRSREPDIVAAVVQKLADSKGLSASLVSELSNIARSTSFDAETRLHAARQLEHLDSRLFEQVVSFVSDEQPPRIRSLAVGVLENAKLEEAQLLDLANNLDSAGALELSRLLSLFEQTKSESVGKQLFHSLRSSKAASALPPDRLARMAEQFGDETAEIARPMLAALVIDTATQSQRLTEMLDALPAGDIRRGQKLFHNQKHACFTCHAVGYRGGTVGPDLSRIGRTRSRRDLLEAIIYPSASFVRSYEPVNVVMNDGRTWSGTITDQSSDGLSLQLNATEAKTINTAEIEEMLPGKVSIMPAGLDKQLTNEQLADLLAFLESRK